MGQQLLWLLAAVLAAAAVAAAHRALALPARPRAVPPAHERVLILGASSGIGRALAHAYAARGARVCIVARRADKLAAVRGNFTGPLLSAVTFIPLLAQSSRRPAILLVSSVAAVIPAPTRTLYGASKAAALLLFQSLSIEHPEIQFSAVLPSTVEGDFRASAVDSGPVRETLSKTLKKDRVARECVRAIDRGLRTLWLPAPFRWAHLLYWIFPAAIVAGARRKYNFR